MNSWAGLLHVPTPNTFALPFSLLSTCVVSAGIQKSRVEDMEERLKADVLREAALYGNQIMVAHENDDFQVVHVAIVSTLRAHLVRCGLGCLAQELAQFFFLKVQERHGRLTLKRSSAGVVP